MQSSIYRIDLFSVQFSEYICFIYRFSFLGKRKLAYAANVSDYPHGTTHHHGAAASGRGTGRGEDDPDHHHVPADKAADGGVRLSEGVHPLEQR